MPYLYLATCVLCNASYSIFAGAYNRKNADRRDASHLYSFLTLLVIFLGWTALFLTDLDFNARVLPYSLLFAAGYTLATVGTVCAMRYGPVSLTSLMLSMSTVLVAIYGLCFWGERMSAVVVIGLVLVVIGMFLVLYTGREKGKRITWRWALFAFLALFGNAACSIAQRNQQMAFDGQYGNMLMMCATFFSTLLCLVLYLRSDKRDSAVIAKSSWHFPVLAGTLNLLMNLLVMKMAATDLSPSLIYPAIGVGGLLLTCLFSAVVLRERLRLSQWVGFVASAAATVLLSI